LHLIRPSLDLVAEVPNTNGSIYLNICAPMEPIRGVTCPPGSVVCLLGVGKPPISIADFNPTTEWDWPHGGSPTITYDSRLGLKI
jgi:hypothetical protein